MEKKGNTKGDSLSGEKLDLVLKVLKDFKYKDLIGNLEGILQKVIDVAEIGEHSQKGEIYSFIDFEKAPGVNGSQHLTSIINAILNKKVLRIYYKPFYEDKPYFINVHPYLIKEYRYRWYLIGLNDLKSELRTYALDRIWEMEEIDTPYKDPGFDPGEYFRNSFGVIAPTGDPPKIMIELSRHQAQYIITQPLHHSQILETEKEQSMVFSLKLHPTIEFIQWIMSMGSEIIVHQPISLRQKVLLEYQKALKRYGIS
jgi:predicted DNA-binding transcriptional regulator YafY